MIKDFEIKDFGPISHINCQHLQKINLIIGANSTGKTFLLKALYSAIKSHEETHRGKEYKDFSEILSDKLYWTFQVEKIGDLVTKGEGRKLDLKLSLNEEKEELRFSFGKDTTRKVTACCNNIAARNANSIFLPPKEVLSLIDVIYQLHQNKEFGFDATYSDLVKALKIRTTKGRNHKEFAQSRSMLENMFAGKVEFDEATSSWIYKRGNSKFAITTAAEGIKKIAILDTLLGNRFLSPESIIFIDEPESALHPDAIVKLLDIIKILSDKGIQFFIATHSYFVIKKLFLLAKQNQMEIPTFVGQQGGTWTQSCLLQDGLPQNGIIDESIRLFEEEYFQN